MSEASSSLSNNELRSYAANGYLVLRNVFAATDIAELETECRRLLERQDLIDSNNIRCRWQNHVETGQCLFECFDPVADISPLCNRVARDPRILEPLAAIYDDEA